jgi:hypothetical protein
MKRVLLCFLYALQFHFDGITNSLFFLFQETVTISNTLFCNFRFPSIPTILHISTWIRDTGAVGEYRNLHYFKMCLCSILQP